MNSRSKCRARLSSLPASSTASTSSTSKLPHRGAYSFASMQQAGHLLSNASPRTEARTRFSAWRLDQRICWRASLAYHRAFSDFPVRYAITVTSSPGGALEAGLAVEDVVPEGDFIEYFIDLPPGTERLITQLIGPPSLITYINPSEPGSALDFQDFVSPFIEGEAATITTDAMAGVERYYFKVITLSGRPADFSLRVTLE